MFSIHVIELTHLSRLFEAPLLSSLEHYTSLALPVQAQDQLFTDVIHIWIIS